MKKLKFKKIFAAFAATLMCLGLCACGTPRVENTRWENEWGYVEFSKEGVMTLKTEDTEQIFYYTDKKGDKDNCYVVTYKSEEEKENGENGVFIPYYIRDGKLYFKGECYDKSK